MTTRSAEDGRLVTARERSRVEREKQARIRAAEADLICEALIAILTALAR
jgi:hypothetical protein